jgi:large subunit ribosomal protein L5
VKIVTNTGIGRLSQQANFEENLLPKIIKEFSLIVGQKPKITRARNSIAGFKIRKGQIVGLTATLRSQRMYDFLEKIIKITLPRVRDFKGLDPKMVDQNGNLTISFKDHLVFPEINPEDSMVDFGLEATIVISGNRNRDEAIELYKLLGIPFKK